jgi:hypothetical protein
MTRSRARGVDLAVVRAAVLGVGLAAVAGCQCQDPVAARCGECLDATGFAVVFDNPVPTVKTLLLYDGWANGWCRTDRTCVGAPDAFLGDLRWGKCATTELVAFAPGFGPRVVADCPRSESNSEVCAGEEPIQLPAETDVQVRVWVAPAPGESQGSLDEALDEARYEMDHAAAAFSRAGAGIRLAYQVNSVNAGDIAAVGAGCAKAGGARTTSSFQSGAINVYYVPSLDMTQAWNPVGESCWPGNRDIAYVARDAKRPALLSHEIGHALGLVTPDDAEGDVDALSEFADYTTVPEVRDNLMNSGVLAFESLWPGQIYRIHFDKGHSWLFLAAGSTGAGQFGHQCQTGSAYTDDPCPPLTLRVQGWP